MSELNSGKIKIKNDGNIIMQFSNYYHVIDSDTELYYKRQADKVIAEKDEKIDVLEERNNEFQKSTDSAWSKVNAMYDELRHANYKRCLAMAELCCERKENCYNIALRKYTKSEADSLVKKSEFWEEWEDTWTQLAYRFNETYNEDKEKESAMYEQNGWIDERNMDPMEPRKGTRFFTIDIKQLK